MALEQLSENLGEAYESVIKRISNQNKDLADLAKMALKWITYAKEPLEIPVLQHALAWTPMNPDVNEKTLVQPEQLVSWCAGIVTIDQESHLIRLVHYTTQTYLEEKLAEPSLSAVHTEIAEICLTYLASDALSKPCEGYGSLINRVEKYKLSYYAGRYWGSHVRGEPEESLQSLVMETFGDEERRDSVLQLTE